MALSRRQDEIAELDPAPAVGRSIGLRVHQVRHTQEVGDVGGGRGFVDVLGGPTCST